MNQFSTGSGQDYVQIFDGPSTDSPILGMQVNRIWTGCRLTGANQAGQYFYSTGSYITLLFRTTSAYVYSGFVLDYQPYGGI